MINSVRPLLQMFLLSRFGCTANAPATPVNAPAISEPAIPNADTWSSEPRTLDALQSMYEVEFKIPARHAGSLATCT